MSTIRQASIRTQWEPFSARCTMGSSYRGAAACFAALIAGPPEHRPGNFGESLPAARIAGHIQQDQSQDQMQRTRIANRTRLR
jgi:hypothetical protein